MDLQLKVNMSELAPIIAAKVALDVEDAFTEAYKVMPDLTDEKILNGLKLTVESSLIKIFRG